jgi:hypothetical protein
MYAREVALPEKTLLDFPQRLLYVRQWHALCETNCVKASISFLDSGSVDTAGSTSVRKEGDG